MKTQNVISHFGSKLKLAQALNVSKSAISQWGDDVPALRAFQIERLTHGALQVNAVVIDNTKSVSAA